METRLSVLFHKEKDYESVRELIIGATEKAAPFECTRCFNGSFGKKGKTAGECTSMKCPVLRYPVLSPLMQLRSTAHIA